MEQLLITYHYVQPLYLKNNTRDTLIYGRNDFFPVQLQQDTSLYIFNQYLRKSCLVLYARFPVINWRSHPVDKSAY